MFLKTPLWLIIGYNVPENYLRGKDVKGGSNARETGSKKRGHKGGRPGHADPGYREDKRVQLCRRSG
jgi:hypothetical protein